MQVAFAVAAGYGVDGQGQNVEGGVFGARKECVVEAAVLVKVKLEHLGGGDEFADFRQADRPQRGDAEQGAKLLGGARNGPFALVVEQALQSGRRAKQRHGQSLPHDRRGHIDVLNPHQHLRHQVAMLEGRGIATIRRFVVRGAVDVVKNRGG